MSTAPEALDLDAIRARADVATQGPWQHVDHGKDGSFMAFIAAARTDVPALLDEIARLRTELRDKGNDLLDVRGLLSPNGGDSVLPTGFDISEQVAPAVEWLVDEVRRLRVVAEAAAAIVTFLRERGWTPANEWFMPETVPFVAAVEAWQQGGGS